VTDPEPDYFSWPFVFIVSVPIEEMEEKEFWKRWLELWQPSEEWMQ
jgi:hypothetical protein